MNAKSPTARTGGVFTAPFICLLVTEALSSLGQATLTFALPLRLLNVTGSASLYGLVTALAMVPSVLLTPIGGAMADRFDKRRAMALLDFLTAATAAAYLGLARHLDPVALTIATMMVVYGLHALYSPTVQATVPFIMDTKQDGESERLTTATALITQVNSLTTMIGPVFAGMLLGFEGIGAVAGMAMSTCALSSLWILLALRIPHALAEKQVATLEAPRTPLKTLLSDFIQVARFLRGRRPLISVNILITVANFVFCAFLNVALPYVVTHLLGLSNQMQGLAEGAIAAGGLAGAVVVSARPAWFSIAHTPALLLACSLCLPPTALTLALGAPAPASYLVLVAATACAMGLIQCISVTVISYEQTRTPSGLVGKVIGLTMCLAMAAMPLGQAAYGLLIDYLPMPAIMAVVTGLMCLTAIYTHGPLANGDAGVRQSGAARNR
ncbi:MFS transporter [Bifidobacterium xylocopae]|uniref:MFS transporter n=1 Tax=Bifidobacterium xylocopae TaxID=2493119 RepID=A0A366KG96_9BIFI|nr:MFS transporter [Bifidobacterium xylocopae]RBQ00114.1 MFS transporter [Bifidobacterium xylocopae]